VSLAVRRNHEASRFEVLVDDEVAGYLTYVPMGGALVLDLTRVDPAYSGQGLASQLVEGALAQARASGLRVVPLCPYVTGWLQSHPEQADLVDADLLAQIEATA
jgi:predicted GNAT family acetyltransferase